MSTSKIDTSLGIRFISDLTIAFIVLKLIGKIMWNWWWVVSPIWIAAGSAILGISIVATIKVWKN